MEAAPIQERANQLTYFFAKYSNFSYRKAGMRVLGYDCGFARSPFGQPIPEADYEAFAAALKPLFG